LATSTGSEETTMERSLNGKVALITGGSSGIGLATAELFLDEGAAVAVVGRDQGRLDAAIGQLASHGDVHAIAGDVSSMSEATRMVDKAAEHFGGLDYVFCNAGIPGVAPIEDLTEELWDYVLGVNLKGIYTIIRASVPHLKRRGGGSIVTMASEAGITGQPHLAAYCASKGGVVNLTRALALELIPHGIRVNCFAPGATETPMAEAEANMAPDPDAVWEMWKDWAPIGRWSVSSEQAKAVLFLMRDATFAVGSVFVQDGGYTAR
jgi:NAD(P)-dependent dehydrogenase (short-subunit alcohol dehydrogenase family)